MTVERMIEILAEMPKDAKIVFEICELGVFDLGKTTVINEIDDIYESINNEVVIQSLII